MPHANSDTRSDPVIAYILLAHGSHDPHWPAVIEAVAERIRQIDPAARVRCAYLESVQPDLAAAIDGLMAEGAQAIAVWPMFLGLGRHARADLPRLIGVAQTRIQARSPDVMITLQPSIAEHASVLDAMARAVLQESI